MKLIEEFRNIHEGKDIWVLGGGPSLDDFPDDFFDDKISIAVSWSFAAFPNCTYYWAMGYEYTAWVKKNLPEQLHKFICGYTTNPEFNKQRRWNSLGQWGDEIFCYAQVVPARVTDSFDKVKSIVDGILAGKHSEFADKGTSIHPATQAAITFGAKRIYFAGCEARTSATQWHAQKRGMDKLYPEKPKQYSKDDQMGNTHFFQICRLGLSWLAKILEGKVELFRYYYGKGEEKIK